MSVAFHGKSPKIPLPNSLYQEYESQEKIGWRSIRSDWSLSQSNQIFLENDREFPLESLLVSFPTDKDFLFNADDICPFFSEAMEPFLEGETGKEALRKMISEEQLELIKMHFGEELRSKHEIGRDGLSLLDVKRVIDTWACSLVHGVDFPGDFDAEMFKEIKSAIFYQMRFSQKKLREMQNSFAYLKLFGLLSAFERRKNDEGFSEIHGLFGHDTNLVGILADFVSLEDIKGRKDKGIVPFAGDLGFIGFRHEETKEAFVQMAYLGEAIPLKDCGFAEYCPVGAFLEILKDKMNFEELDECKKTLNVSEL